MSEGKRDSGGQDSDLRELLGLEHVRTSRRHDEIVVSAARELARIHRRVDQPVGSTGGRLRRWRRAVPVSLAAGVAAMVIALYPRTQQHREDDALRSVEANIEQLVSPLGTATLPAPPTNFRWPKQEGATSYRVVLRNASADVIWRSAAVADTQVALDDPVRATLQPQTYYWTIEVTSVGAARKLGPFWFQLK
jgi:hypothetical protein